MLISSLDYILKFIKLKKLNIFVLFIAFTYFSIGITNSNVYYKSELVSPLISDIQSLYNDKSTTIIVTGEQYPALLYYSKNTVEFVNLIDEKACIKKVPNINNLMVYKKGVFYKNFSGTPIAINTQELTLNKNVILIGIELKGTSGKFRSVEKILKDKNYNFKNSQKYSDGIISLNFKR